MGAADAMRLVQKTGQVTIAFHAVVPLHLGNDPQPQDSWPEEFPDLAVRLRRRRFQKKLNVAFSV